MTKHKFETEVNQLLQLIVHSLYSNQEVFLRELVSNASDALDKLKHLTLVDERYKQLELDPVIDIEFDPDTKTISIRDNGIGMDREDLIEQLGTIARSGTRKFLEQMNRENRADSNLIGQFGVGFYSCFMVADFVEVITRKALEDTSWCWSSNGKGEYDLIESDRESHGTTVLLRLNEAGREYANRWSIETIIKKYSNHIFFPIKLHYHETRFEGEGVDKQEIKEAKESRLNDGTALWRRPKRELTDKEYHDFYKSLTHDNEDPFLTIHTQAEGNFEYTTLFFIPSKAPMDLYYANHRPGVRLYIKRVFITDSEKDLLPVWLRFVQGVIDSEDLPLNVSREVLQKNALLEKICNTSVKKILDELEKLSEDEEKYARFWSEFQRPMKEGLYGDYLNREKLLELVRFRTTHAEGWTSLAAYCGRMQEKQKSIYYITGSNERHLKDSPLLEAYRDKGIEVLLMGDEIDEIVVPMVGKYKEFEFKSVNRAEGDQDLKTDEDTQTKSDSISLLERLKKVLDDKVKDVRTSYRLSASPACIVVDDKDPTVHMQSILKTLGQNAPELKPILEINPDHPIVKKLDKLEDDNLFSDIGYLLFEQAMLIEGMEIESPAKFVKRINTIMDRAL